MAYQSFALTPKGLPCSHGPFGIAHWSFGRLTVAARTTVGEHPVDKTLYLRKCRGPVIIG